MAYHRPREVELSPALGDNNIYFDCGYSNNGFDRINKVALARSRRAMESLGFLPRMPLPVI